MKILSPGTSGQNKCLVENERFSSHTSSFILSGVSSLENICNAFGAQTDERGVLSVC